MKSLCALLLAVLVTPSLAQGVAEDEREPSWYQVEIIIFRYLETAAETENWPALPELSYPPHLRHLRAGMTDSDLQQEFLLQRIEDTVPTPAFDLAWDKSVAELRRVYQGSLDAPGVALTLPTPESVADPAPVIDPTSLTVPRAFVLMPADAAEFATEALRIRRSRDMRLMFHQSWLQPMRSREHSLPIVIDGVIAEGNYPALQGSVMLYVSRYLHIETNLWLNTRSEEAAATPAGFIPEGESAEPAWTMPAPPLPPQAYRWTPWSFRVELEAGFSDAIVLPPENLESLELVPVVELDPADSLQPIVISARRIGVLDIEQFLEQPWYPFEHAVRVQYKRRMRGGELHYLDHPLLGLILRVSPYQFEPFYQPQVRLAQELTGEVAGTSPGSRR
ncbi:MAG: CsiV family protein [Gammaproteobacteria bacterium]|nr:CsiV family protein [Gammaproteobacteria bacterium]